MKSALLKLVIKTLEETTAKIKAGNCELAEDEAIELVETLAHIGLSADLAMSELNISRSLFETLKKEGKLPQGKKVRGFKELRYYKDLILKILNKI